MSWCDDLTFDLVIVTMSFKIFSRLFLRFHKVKKVDSWTLIKGCRCASWCGLSPAIFETSFSYDKDMDCCNCLLYAFCIILLFPLSAFLQLINFTAS